MLGTKCWMGKEVQSLAKSTFLSSLQHRHLILYSLHLILYNLPQRFYYFMVNINFKIFCSFLKCECSLYNWIISSNAYIWICTLRYNLNQNIIMIISLERKRGKIFSFVSGQLFQSEIGLWYVTILTHISLSTEILNVSLFVALL